MPPNTTHRDNFAMSRCVTVTWAQSDGQRVYRNVDIAHRGTVPRKSRLPCKDRIALIPTVRSFWNGETARFRFANAPVGWNVASTSRGPNQLRIKYAVDNLLAIHILYIRRDCFVERDSGQRLDHPLPCSRPLKIALLETRVVVAVA